MYYMAVMIAFFFSTVTGGPETTAIKCRGSAKSSLFQLLIRSNVHSRGVCGGNKPLLQVIELASKHTLMTTKTIPLQRLPQTMKRTSTNSRCVQTSCLFWSDPCSTSLVVLWGNHKCGQNHTSFS